MVMVQYTTFTNESLCENVFVMTSLCQLIALYWLIWRALHHYYWAYELLWYYKATCMYVCMHTRWTGEKNYSSEFSVLQETSTTLQCFVRLQVLRSRVRKCIQAVGGHFERFAWVLNGEFVTAHLTA